MNSFTQIAIATALLLAGCNEKDSNPVSPVTPEPVKKIVGRLLLPDGKPAIGAKIRIYPVNHAPAAQALAKTAEKKDLVYSALTDDKGQYEVDSLAAGEYNIMGEGGSLVSYQDSVFLKGTTGTIPAGTLSEPVQVRGYVVLQPQDNRKRHSVVVQILGTNVFANVSDSGVFHLPKMAEGTYSARINTTLPEYTTLFTSVKVMPAGNVAVTDTFALPFTGIPVVTGLKTSFDTVNSLVHVRWNETSFADFQEYQVFRSVKGDLQLNQVLVARTTRNFIDDKVFFDAPQGGWYAVDESGFSSLQYPDAFPQGQLRGIEYEYQVVIRDKSLVPGPIYGNAAIEALAPSAVKTYIDIETPGFPGGRTTMNDTVTLIAHFYNRTRSNVKVGWFKDGDIEPVKVVDWNGLVGVDTLVIVCPANFAMVNYTARVTDEAGDTWEAAQLLNVVSDPPVISTGKTATAARESQILLDAAGTDFGSIVKWEWDIGNTGTFLRTSGPDTLIELPSIPNPQFRSRVRATDNDGETTIAMQDVEIRPSRLRKPMQTPRVKFAIVAWGGKIYAIGGSNDVVNSLNTMEIFDPAANTWTPGPSFSHARRDFGAAVLNDKFYLIGGIASDGSHVATIEVFDPVAGTWSPGPVLSGEQKYMGVKGGLVYSYDESNLNNGLVFNAFNPDIGTLTASGGTNATYFGGLKIKEPVVMVQDKVFIMGFNEGLVIWDMTTGEFSNNGLSWMHVKSFPGTSPDMTRFGVANHEGYLYIAGGYNGNVGQRAQIDRIYKSPADFSPWTEMPRILVARQHPSMVMLGGNLYLIGGYNPNLANPTLNIVEEYQP